MRDPRLHVGLVDRPAGRVGEPPIIRYSGRAAFVCLPSAEERAVGSFAGLLRVTRGDLEVNHLSGHACTLLLVRFRDSARPPPFIQYDERGTRLSTSTREWSQPGSNRRPSGCQPDALPSSYGPWTGVILASAARRSRSTQERVWLQPDPGSTDTSHRATLEVTAARRLEKREPRRPSRFARAVRFVRELFSSRPDERARPSRRRG